MGAKIVSYIKHALNAVLFAAACSGAVADDLTSAGRSPGRDWIDFRFAANAGAFIYMQEVEGGYYINGRPYDLDWYGLLGEMTGIIEIPIPVLGGAGVGIGGCLQYALTPAAVDEMSHFAERTDSGALGGYGGLSTSYDFNDLRLNVIAGYGGTGVVSYYGGSGPALSLGVDYPLANSMFRLGISIRYLIMYLYHPGSESVRSEQGPYMSFSIGGVVDWIP